MSRVIATSSVRMKLLSLMGAVFSAGICAFWHEAFGSRERRSVLARSLGYFVFAAGSMVPFLTFYQFAAHEVRAALGLTKIATLPVGPLVASGLTASALLLTLAYILQFKRRTS